jgi:hypothetical protein
MQLGRSTVHAYASQSGRRSPGLLFVVGQSAILCLQDAGQRFKERKLHMLRDTAQMCIELGCEAAVFLIDKDGKFHQFSTSSQPAKQMMRLLACHMDESLTIKDVGATSTYCCMMDARS